MPGVPDGLVMLAAIVKVFVFVSAPIITLPAVISWVSNVVGTLNVPAPPMVTVCVPLGNSETVPLPAFSVLVVVLPKASALAVIEMF